MPQVAVAKALSPIAMEPAIASDSQLQPVITDVLSTLKTSYLNVAAEEKAAASGQADQMFRKYIASRTASVRALHQKNARSVLEGPMAVRTAHLGRYAAIDPKLYATLGSDAIGNHVARLAVDSEAILASLEKHGTEMAATPIFGKAPPPVAPVNHLIPTLPTADQTAGLAFKKLRLYITKVRCLAETSELSASDEINMGGSSVDPKGRTSLINEFVVSDDFDKGEEVNYGFSRVFAAWNLETKPGGFPYVYTAVVAMAEKDDGGGFYEFLTALWEKIHIAVIAAIGAAAGAAIGAAIGAAFAGFGALVGAAFGAFITWLIGLFNNPDDIMCVVPVRMTLAATTKSYYDWAKLTTPGGYASMLDIRSDGGRYLVDLAFKVSAA